MKAWIFEQTGSTDVMVLKEIPAPVLKQDEVLIQVRAFGINRLEVDVRAGAYGPINSPVVAGIEAVGEVINDPTGEFSPGQAVATAMGGMGFDRTGSYAEQVAVRRENVIALGPTHLEWSELASLPEAFLTAWGALVPSMRLRSGQKVLIRGATSSVGQASIILAKQLGAEVIASTRRESLRHRLTKLGADAVIIDNGEIAPALREIWPTGADAVLEIVGAATLRDSLKAVRPFGEVVVIGLLSGRVIPELDLLADLPDAVGVRFFSTQMLGTSHLPLTNAPLADIARLRASGAVPSLLAHEFTFEQLPQAHQLMESNQAQGKIVVSL